MSVRMRILRKRGCCMSCHVRRMQIKSPHKDTISDWQQCWWLFQIFRDITPPRSPEVSLDCLNLKLKAIEYFQASVNFSRWTQCNVQKDLNLQCKQNDKIFFKCGKFQKFRQGVNQSGIHESNMFNPLKTKRRSLYLKTQFVPRCKHFSSRL